jgi:hypothetical protein
MYSLAMLSQHAIWLFVAWSSDEKWTSPSSSLPPLAPLSKRFLSHESILEFEVCLSPGCIADGAQSTLDQLFALAPPGVWAKPGVCCSLCGNGPIVVDNANNKKYKRVVSGTAKVVDLVSQNGEFGKTLTSMQQAILDGYDVITQANEALAKQDFAAAESLYEKGITTALDPAKELQQAREQYESKYRIDQVKSETQGPVAPPRGLQWLIQAYQGKARAQSKIGNIDAAVVSAQKACDLSLNSSPQALEILQEMYQAQGNVSAELSALLLYFDLPEPEKATTVVSNKRRHLGFRRAKLEREAKGAS